jgi:hypothetical protein
VLVSFNEWNPDKQLTSSLETNNRLREFRRHFENSIEAIMKGEAFTEVTSDIKELQVLFATAIQKQR